MRDTTPTPAEEEEKYPEPEAQFPQLDDEAQQNMAAIAELEAEAQKGLMGEEGEDDLRLEGEDIMLKN
jgi:hypothetical protein